MSGLVDRVARAICKAGGAGAFDLQPAAEKARLRAQARAAIAAVREPSAAMLDAAQELTVRQVAVDEAALWRAMVDAALARPASARARD